MKRRPRVSEAGSVMMVLATDALLTVRQPDASLAEKALGWKPHVPIRDGLEKTLEYFKQKISEAA